MNKSLNKEIRALMDTVMKDMYLLDKEIETTFGLTSARIFTLLAFNTSEIMKMKELSNSLSLTSSTMTRMIDNLVKEGLVERGHEPRDRRLVIVKLTNEGKKLTDNIKVYKEKYFKSVMENVESDGKEMASSLKILISAFERFKS
ncbi:MAG: MarR family transcriptional regulator [Candidatus Scalindua sediminis]|nr:MarR family transcriptional regulator [Candidatus Scalindua sediminis]